jgi:hypothetical protein
MSQLRVIAIHVEEPQTGRFTWVLTERDGPSWQELAKAAAPARSFKKAMADGLLELQSMVEDLDAGPRRPEIPASPGREGTRRTGRGAAPKDGEVPTNRSYFGFGPAR